MGIIKDNNYSTEELQFARIGRALSHPVRRKIIDRLQREIIARHYDLTRDLNLSLASISSHLEKLKDANLIVEKYEMHYHEIYLNPDGFKLMRTYLNKMDRKFSKMG